ncbi:hypothetical protein EI94DRAFT_1704111 [Lactarius quietus]|nr:hypothetical protein EI94DRAFT_1704111 [Lactarius quietus]
MSLLEKCLLHTFSTKLQNLKLNATCDALKSVSVQCLMDHFFQDTTPKKECDHTNIAFWHKKAFLLEKRRHHTSKKLCAGTGQDTKSNITFWFLQHKDSSVLLKSDVSDMRGKRIIPLPTTRRLTVLQSALAVLATPSPIWLCNAPMPPVCGDDMEADDNGLQCNDWEGINYEDDDNVFINHNIEHIIMPLTHSAQHSSALTTPLEPFTTLGALTAPFPHLMLSMLAPHV